MNHAVCTFGKHLIIEWSEDTIRGDNHPPGRHRIMSSAIDRSAASQALAKVIAYHQAGKAAMVKEWAQRLVTILRNAGVDVS
jgi:hypothetical protein